jgi:hypothetical protein
MKSSLLHYLGFKQWQPKKELVDASTPLLDDVDVVHVVQVGPCNAHFRGTTFSSMRSLHTKQSIFWYQGANFWGVPLNLV